MEREALDKAVVYSVVTVLPKRIGTVRDFYWLLAA